MARTNLLSRRIGDTLLDLNREVLRQPEPDPGYDMPTTLYTVRVHDIDDMYLDTREHAYASYDVALAEFEREFVRQAVAVAKRAMRRAA